MPIKVIDLAKELGVSNTELVDALRKLYVDVDDENSRVNDKIADLMRVKLGAPKEAKKKKAKKEEKAAPARKTKKTAKIEEEAEETKGKVTEEKKEELPTKEVQEFPEQTAEQSVVKEEKTPEAKPKEEDKNSPTVTKVRKVVVVKAAATAIEPQQTKESALLKEEKEKKELARKIFKKKKKTVYERDEDIVDAVEPVDVIDMPIVAAPVAPAAPAKPMKRHITVAKKKPEIGREEIKPYQGTAFQKIEMQVPITIRGIAVKVNKRTNDLIQYLMKKGVLVNINQALDEPVVRELLKDLGYELELSRTIEEDLMAEHREPEKEGTHLRAPVVTFMGHVDHGKTSLLDYIRKTKVAKKEKGGITQHIGAYQVETPKGAITFLDTPGHEAFTAMRARGANATDIVVLVVAADDGVMPQTKEAIDHAQAAGVPIVVAINKCDLPNVNPDKVKFALQKENILSEDFGGKTVMVKVSAKTGEGVDTLLEMLLLEAEMLELKSTPGIRARGVVVEGRKSAGQGVMATLLVKNGTLREGDLILTGIYFGKIKAMLNDRGERIKEAPPATPVEVLGLEGVPEAGDEFFVVKDEKKARTLALLKQDEIKKKKMIGSQRITLEDFHSHLVKGEVKELKIILKADVQGSIEAIVHSLSDLSTEEVKLNFVHTMVGDINESNVMLAMVSNAVIIGFHVKVEPKAESLAKQESIDVRVYDVIYEAQDDVKAAMEGLLEPIEQEVFQGAAQIREVFPSKIGKAAGCIVTKGVIHRKDRIRLKRSKEVIFEGTISDLRRFKDDVKEVKDGFECGISFNNFNEFRAGDVIEAYMIEKVARRLEKPKK